MAPATVSTTETRSETIVDVREKPQEDASPLGKECDALTHLFVGNLILALPKPDRLFNSAPATLQRDDVVIGHVEVPRTNTVFERMVEVPALPSDPAHLLALGLAGLHVATLAGNHFCVSGLVGIAALSYRATSPPARG